MNMYSDDKAQTNTNDADVIPLNEPLYLGLLKLTPQALCC